MDAHRPVLVNEILEALRPLSIKRFIDGTLGAGGHAEAILRAHSEIERYTGIDRDASALELAASRLTPFHDKLEFIHAAYTAIEGEADAILLDLGVSSMQLDNPDRGFSFSKEGPLDMRMDASSELTAAKIVNEWDEEELATIFFEYGEIRKSRALAALIVAHRPFTTTTQLASLARPLLARGSGGKIDPVTTLFQALRMAVNDELGLLNEALKKGVEALNRGGRLLVITFHSLEDRLVKHHFKALAATSYDDPMQPQNRRVALNPTIKLITKQPRLPSEQEVRENRRARSAKLRVVEKL